MRALVFLWLLNPQPVETKAEPITIQVGEKREIRVRAPRGQCDDKTIVKVEDGGEWLRLVGLKEGMTKCGFYAAKAAKPFRLFAVTVVSATTE